MITLERLKNHCIELDEKGLGYMHPHVSAVDLLVLIAQLEEQADNYCQALEAVRDSGDIQNQSVMDMLDRGLNNQPQVR